MNQPKVQDDVVPEGGTSPAVNPEGRTPLGIPVEADEADPTGRAGDERFETETAPLRTGKDEPSPKR